MDEILRKLGSQSDLERKIDVLTAENEKMRRDMKVMYGKVSKLEIIVEDNAKKVVEEVKNSKEIKKIIDTVETSEGYIELFVKDFQKIHSKLQTIDVAVASKVQAECNKMENVFKEIVQTINHPEDVASEHLKLNNRLGSITQKFEMISTGITRSFRMIEQIATSIQLGSSVAAEKWELIDEITKELAILKPTHKCHFCQNALPRCLPLRLDNVSVRCQCSTFNILPKNKHDHKWMYITCQTNNGHYVQFPVGQKEGSTKKCAICGKEGKLQSTTSFAIPY